MHATEVHRSQFVHPISTVYLLPLWMQAEHSQHTSVRREALILNSDTHSFVKFIKYQCAAQALLDHLHYI